MGRQVTRLEAISEVLEGQTQMVRDTQQELTQHVSSRLVASEAGLSERVLQLRQEVDQLPKKYEQGVAAVKAESGKIAAVMAGTIKQMTGVV